MLDRTRPYGEVHGASNVRYEQDGKQFDAQGEEITAEQPAKRPGRKPKGDE